MILVAVATPILGVVKAGLVAKTKAPLPVSSLITPANWTEVVAEKTDKSLVVKVKVPVLLGTVIVRSAVGSVILKVVSKSLAVFPSKTSGVGPEIVPVKVMVSVEASPRVVLSCTMRFPPIVVAPVEVEPVKIKLFP